MSNSNISTAVINDYSDADSKLRFETVIMPELENRPNAAYVILNGSNEDAAAIEQATKVAKPEPAKKNMRFVIVDDESKLLTIVSAFREDHMIFTSYGQGNDISVMVHCTITEWPNKIIEAIKAIRNNDWITEEEIEELIK